MILKPETVIVNTKSDAKILGIPDIHFPFENTKALKEVLSIVKVEKPTHVVQVGDLFDLYTFSRFSRSIDLITPKQELEEGRAKAVEFWRNIQTKSPNVKCYQLRGNHSERIEKNLMNKAPEYESLMKEPVKRLLEFKGVQSMVSSKSELVINDRVYIHGWSCTPGFHVRYFLKSVVCGHSHRGGVFTVAHNDKTLTELNVGHLSDVKQLPLQYTETKTSRWTLGCGMVDKYGSRFIAL